MVKKIFLVLLIIVSIASVSFAQSYKFVHYEYEVKEGDTLIGISQKFMAKNTYGKRSLEEFMSGIIEINPPLWKDKKVYAGEKLMINWFERMEK